MKLRAWHIAKIKKLLRLYEPSKDYLEKSLIEMIELCNREEAPVAKVLLLTCFTCGKEFERNYSEYMSKMRSRIGGGKRKTFCSKNCSLLYSMPILKKSSNSIDKYYEVKQQSKKYYGREENEGFS